MFSLVAFLSVGAIPKELSVRAAWELVEINDVKYSAKFDEDIIFSAEKVSVPVNDSVGFDNANFDYFQTTNGKNLFFNKSTKEVVEDGKFVKLDNVLSGTGNSAVWTNGEVEAGKDNPNVFMTDAVMVSLGHYIYSIDSNGESVSTTSNGTNAGITALTVSGAHNGKAISSDELQIRTINVDGGPYYDFVYLIKQEDGADGYYEFTFDYMAKGNKPEPITFGFYVIFESSYVQEKIINEQNYSSAPTLQWEGSTSTVKDGSLRYYTGVDGIKDGNVIYPTITYDYTKYNFAYTLTQDRDTVHYNYNLETRNEGSSTLADIVLTKTYELEGSSSTSIRMIYYNPSNGNNIVSIMLTEPGYYSFEFNYIYSGFNSENAPDVNIELDGEKKVSPLTIHGFELNYSKYGYNSANLQYFTIANVPQRNGNKPVDGIDLIVPNGHEISEDVSQLEKLEFLYEVDNSETYKGLRVGTIISDLSENPLVAGSKAESGGSLSAPVFSDTNADGYLDIDYVRTNQGSLWLTYLDTFESETDKPYYYYSPTKFKELTEGDKAEFTNQTSFNKNGFYLVFIKVIPAGMTTDDPFYQVFAFEYSADTIVINVKTDCDETGNQISEDKKQIIAAGKYTNDSVVVSWDMPNKFDKKITGFYYISKNQDRDVEKFETELPRTKMEANENSGKYTYKLGDLNQVKLGEYAKYLIQIQREDGSTTNMMFTIDRTPISGVKAYTVEESLVGGKTFYKRGYIEIKHGITDSLASLEWDDKSSGAKITAKYTYMPFVKSSEKPEMLGNNRWIRTNYKLGSMVESQILQESSLGFIDPTAVIHGQGIFLISIEDEAGNVAKYMLVIDKTEAYYKVVDIKGNVRYCCGDSLLFSDNIVYDVGTHKVIELKNFEYEEAKTQVINTEMIRSLFGELASQKYLIVKHQEIKVVDSLQNNCNGIYYDGEDDDEIKNEKEEHKIGEENQINWDFEKFDSTSVIRKVYLKGLNNVDSSTFGDIETTKAYLFVEINTDNSKLMAYQSDSDLNKNTLPQEGQDKNGIERLYTGSSISGAHATSSDLIGIRWRMGEGDYAIESITYDFYSLNLNTTSFNADGNIYYYEKQSESNVIYSATEGFHENGESYGLFGYMFFGTSSKPADEGLYIITRTYKGNIPAGGKDQKTVKYYFILDRNGIIQTSSEIGTNIRFEFMNDDHYKFSDFSSTLPIDGIISSYTSLTTNKIINNEHYEVSLSTNRVPAQLRVPVAKYFDDKNKLSNYSAGKLNLQIHFVDRFSQTVTNGRIYSSRDVKVDEDGYFLIDFSALLNDENENLKNIGKRILADDTHKDWMSLPGHYVVIIEDNVLDSNGNPNKCIFAIEIKEPKTPEVEIYADGIKADKDSNEMDTAVVDSVATSPNADVHFEVITNAEYVMVELKKPNDLDLSNAQVDNTKIFVEQYINGNKTDAYKDLSVDTESESVVKSNVNQSKYVFLNTLLRNADGTINVHNFNNSLYYLVKVRYQIPSDGNITPDGLNVFYYYNQAGERKPYYETTYKITIDRLAPQDNINNLIETNELVSYYVDDYNSDLQKAGLENSDSLFENGYQTQGNNKLFFSNYYSAYFKLKQKGIEDSSKIFVFKVNGDTEFIRSEDLKEIKYKKYNNFTDLTAIKLNLPIAQGYEELPSVTAIENPTFGELFKSLNYKYFEVVEIDYANNVTQYVIYLDDETDNSVYVPLTMELAYISGTEEQEKKVGDEKWQVSIFKVEGNGESTIGNDKFFRIELTKNSVVVDSINTSIKTLKSDLADQVADMIMSAGIGNYVLKLKTLEWNESEKTYKQKVKEYVIDLYDESNKQELDIDKLVEGNYINFSGANIYDEETGIWYYAKTIKVTFDGITHVYNCDPSQNFKYFDENGDFVAGLLCQDNTTYRIEMIDNFKQSKFKRFNPSGKEFYSVDFEGFGDYFRSEDGTIHAFASGNVTYDKIFNKVILNYNSTEYIISVEDGNVLASPVLPSEVFELSSVEGNVVLKIKANAAISGGVVNVKVKFIEVVDGVDQPDAEYKIVIDNRTANVKLRDFTTGADKILKSKANVENYDDVITESINVGTMYLSWDAEDFEGNSNFEYSYKLYEKINMGDDSYEYQPYAIKNENGTSVSTLREDSTGDFRFVVEIRSLDGSVLYGNVVYAFNIQARNNKLYVITDESGEVVENNSNFTFDELDQSVKNEIKSKFYLSELPSGNVELYVTNQKLNVATVDNAEIVSSYYTYKTSYYELVIYQIKATTYKLYFGILNVKWDENDALIQNLKVKTVSSTSSTEHTFKDDEFVKTVAGDPSMKVEIFGDLLSHNASNALLSKNVAVVEVYYNDEFVTNITPNMDGNKFIQAIDGSGIYSLVFKDLAGNTHLKGQKFTLTILKEVLVTINGELPVQNAFYNDSVDMKIFATSRYQTGSIKVDIYKNGQKTSSANKTSYRFSEFGTYRVDVVANYKEGEQITELEKSVSFTIVNKEEARSYIDLTCLNSYKIDEILNAAGDEVSDYVLNNIFGVASTDGLLLEYSKLMQEEHADNLGLTAGKTYFTWKYTASDITTKFYPNRTIEFTFSLNDEIPTIECSLPTGETTTKGFDIMFNPGKIYQQIGESYVYINNEIVATINSSSVIGRESISRTFKNNGAGDFYVMLVSSSGTVLTSYKITIKEPLNAWAIVLIIVAVVVVATVVTVILILRHKMKIR